MNTPKTYDYVRVRLTHKHTGTHTTTISIRPEEYMRLVRNTGLHPRALNTYIRGIVQQVAPSNPKNLSAAVRGRLFQAAEGSA